MVSFLSQGQPTETTFRNSWPASFSGYHAKRILSLANTTGVLAAGSLAVSAIGQGLATSAIWTRSIRSNWSRLLDSAKIDVRSYFAYWVPYLVSERKEIIVALDWTDFDRDKQTTIALNT